MKINTNKVVLILAEKEMTKTNLAERCEISRHNLSTILGWGTCSPKTAGKLAKGLGISITEIMED